MFETRLYKQEANEINIGYGLSNINTVEFFIQHGNIGKTIINFYEPLLTSNKNLYKKPLPVYTRRQRSIKNNIFLILIKIYYRFFENRF